jgi:hypothetical protein
VKVMVDIRWNVTINSDKGYWKVCGPKAWLKDLLLIWVSYCFRFHAVTRAATRTVPEHQQRESDGVADYIIDRR